MRTNQFEDSRVADGTLRPGANRDGLALNESNAVSRDDGRDGIVRQESNSPGNQHRGPRRVLAASTLTGDRVRNPAGEALGTIDEVMIDLKSGRIAYAVLSYGGFLGIGDKLFAVPWSALRVDQSEHEFVLDVGSKMLEDAPGFDKGNWPDMADPSFGAEVHKYYGQPYWDERVTDAGDFTGAEHSPDTGQSSSLYRH